MDEEKQQLLNQITDSAGNVVYTFSAHWNIVNRLKKRYQIIKTAQIILTAISTGGFLTSILSGLSYLSWVGGLTSAIALGLNLYTLNFNMLESIKSHTDAANELWDVREAYKSLISDVPYIEVDKIRAERDRLTQEISRINKNYPGTDEKSFTKAQKEIGKYQFAEGEVEELLHIHKPE